MSIVHPPPESSFAAANYLQPPNRGPISDLDGYPDGSSVRATNAKDPNWLCNWWRSREDELVAGDYHAIPACQA
jgi:hypothetical protein